MRFAALLLVLVLSTPTWADGCEPVGEVVEAQKERGVVTWLRGKTAKEVVKQIWTEAGQAKPWGIDALLVVFLYEGGVVLIPVRDDKVCVSGLPTTRERILALLK